MSNNEQKFRKMWNWIAKKTEDTWTRIEEEDFFRHEEEESDFWGYPQRPFHRSFACEEARERCIKAGEDPADYRSLCKYCPVVWSKDVNPKEIWDASLLCYREGGLSQWGYAYHWDEIPEAIEWAEKFSQLDWVD